jgi:cytochrome c oxidase subunit 2
VVARERGWRMARLAGLGVTVAVLLAGCSFDDSVHGFGWFKGITPEGRRMYDLWIAASIAALAVGVFVWGLIFWCVVRYRKRGDELPPQTRFNMPLEFLYTIVPVLIVCVLFYYTAITQTYVDKREPNPDVVVTVTAFKWNWKFTHTKVDGDEVKGAAGQEITTIGASDYVPVLVVPTGRRIEFIERSEDVVHSFWVPEMLFKRDVFPAKASEGGELEGIENRFQVTIDREGAFVGRCAELCGAYHSMMNFELRAVSQSKFDEYLKHRKDGDSTPEALAAIGEPGYATTTHPFQREPEQNDTRGASR